MNYIQHYISLIEKAKLRTTLEGYKEEHHIQPKDFGGSDEETNLISLTAREHFIAHRLLAKIYPDSSMVHAVWMMVNFHKSDLKITSRTYEVLKLAHSRRLSENFANRLSLSIRNSGEGNPMFGKTHTEEARKIISEANKQQIECPYCGKIGGIAIMKRWHFDWCKQNPKSLSEWQRKTKRVSPTEETRKKISAANKGKPNPLKGLPQKKDTVCPHCGMVGGIGQMSRWHFDNCKQKENLHE